MLKRLFDIFFSLLGVILLTPLFLIIAILILVDSRGGVFYKQLRVGYNNSDFKLFKFRTMAIGSDKKGLITVGSRDSRVTPIGYYLRKYKIDELPQLINVLIGDMSLVGPRPEVRKYVSMYTQDQLRVLSVRPGITDYASLEYSNENELLGNSENPEEMYINEIMPAKLALNIKYIEEKSILKDFSLILKTLFKIIS
jgi:lipopolysaccharide/colanic/teichoic acid biosynthesis glycosyltransferase